MPRKKQLSAAKLATIKKANENAQATYAQRRLLKQTAAAQAAPGSEAFPAAADPLAMLSAIAAVADEPPPSLRIKAVVDAMYSDIDGYAIAKDEKRRQRDAGVFLEGIQYGEINPTAFVRALSWCSPKSGESFIDLGSGTGKAVMTAAATYAFSSATGVELLRPLHDAAVAALARSDANTLLTKDVRFVCADALEHDWIGHDIVFVSLTCFSDEQVARVAAGAEKMRVGARLLVTTKALEGRNSQGHADRKRAFPSLKLLHNDQLHYGKGKLTFRAYERV